MAPPPPPPSNDNFNRQLTSLLFRLPSELRNHIYGICATNYIQVACGGTPLDPDSFLLLRDAHVTPIPSLLLSCKLVAREATPVLYSLARLRYFTVLGSTRVEVHAVGRFTPSAVVRLDVEIDTRGQPACWRQACLNLTRLVPRLAGLETLCIDLPARYAGWHSRDKGSQQNIVNGDGQAGVAAPSNSSSSSRSRSSKRPSSLHSAWQLLEPVLTAAMHVSGGQHFTTLEFRGSHSRQYTRLAQEHLGPGSPLQVVLGARVNEHIIPEMEEDEEEGVGEASDEDSEGPDSVGDGHAGYGVGVGGGGGGEAGADDVFDEESAARSSRPRRIPQWPSRATESNNKQLPMTPAITIRRPPRTQHHEFSPGRPCASFHMMREHET
ncbi:hypothetical protein Micbo1qcDRAFT_156950 [Microdochium bolleyi]|uniref:F-box domain-containing protein n=1 Tax=Microdochium bolleyi TaxID=196109 RepID=A0A136JDA8_9PEZI|nr:hypothetical protein Micbo1qcDRAFT_156950 [Microdochium bolleyi]